MLNQKITEDYLRVAAAAFDTHDAIMVTNQNAIILRVYKAFENITGYSEKEVVGRNPSIIKSGHHDKNFYTKMWSDLLRNGSWSGEIWDKRKDGTIYPTYSTFTAVKNVNAETIQYVAVFTNISERKKAEDDIYRLAFYDPLTSLPNRRLLLDRLEVAFAASKRSKKYGALLFLDLDKFKTLNDTLGHKYGDLLLIEVAKRLKSNLRESDTVARIGGDEFVIFLENLSIDEKKAANFAANFAEKLCVLLAEPYYLEDHSHHSSSSIGVCLFKYKEFTDVELLKRADIAMYQAKLLGRNRVCFFDPYMQQIMDSRASLELDLRKAIVENELELYYQIQVDLNKNPIGVEGLLRWKHPLLGFIPPSEFIPIAEESSLILKIGQWVLDEACKQIAIWSTSEQLSNLVIAINISALQFKQINFVDQIESLIKKYNIAPSRLKLELTESVFIDDFEALIIKMLKLRDDIGVTLSLDDFGTGYSSLSYLKKLPIDQLKLDQSFVREMFNSRNDELMVKNIIDMAHNFGLKVIAEGVETEDQFEMLARNGCTSFQGYLFSKPIPIDQFDLLIRNIVKSNC